MPKLSKTAKTITRSFKGWDRWVYPVGPSGAVVPRLQRAGDYPTRHPSVRNRDGGSWGFVATSKPGIASYSIAHAIDYFGLVPSGIDKVLCLGPDSSVEECYDWEFFEQRGSAVLYDDTGALGVRPSVDSATFSYDAECAGREEFKVYPGRRLSAAVAAMVPHLVVLAPSVKVECPQLAYNGKVGPYAVTRFLRSCGESRRLSPRPDFAYVLASRAAELFDVWMPSSPEGIAHAVSRLSLGSVEADLSAFENGGDEGYLDEELPCWISDDGQAPIRSVLAARADLCEALFALGAIWKRSLEDVGLAFGSPITTNGAFSEEVADAMAEISGARRRIEAWLGGVPLDDLLAAR